MATGLGRSSTWSIGSARKKTTRRSDAMRVPMTKIDGCPDRATAIAGMAHYAGSGPPGTTCSTCAHRGYSRETKNGKWRKTTACRVYKSLTGRHGAVVAKENASCKYFEVARKF